MSRRILIALVTVLIIAVAVLSVLHPRAERKYVVDEFGERHEVIEGVLLSYVLIKYEPSRYAWSEDSWRGYIRGKYAAWDKWRKLVDKYGDERYPAYVMPCRLLTFEEFLQLVEKHKLHKSVVTIYTDVYLANGTWFGHGRAGVSDSVEKTLEYIRDRAEFVVKDFYRRLYGLNISSDEIVVYVEAFLVNATLRELDALRKSEDILMVDLPLDLIWRYRERGKIVEVRRLTFGTRFLTREDSCWIKKAG
ncbi:MAG: hypothetical protein ACK4SY_05550 [Pyrobaculum sp.]